MGDLVICKSRFNFWECKLYITGLESAKKSYQNDCFYLRHKHKVSILSSLSDFVTYISHLNIQSEVSIFKL